MDVWTINVGFFQEIEDEGRLVHVDRNITVCMSFVGGFNETKMAKKTMKLYFDFVFKFYVKSCFTHRTNSEVDSNVIV